MGVERSAPISSVLSADLLDLIGVGTDIGTIAEAIYEVN
jgi:hypothetical protein